MSGIRYLIALLFCLAALASASAQDAAPAATPFKEVTYENPDGPATITLTGTATLVYLSDGKKREGKYTVADNKMHVDLVPDEHSTAPDHMDFDMPVEGMLLDAKHKARFATNDGIEKANSRMAGVKCLSNAKQIVLACRLYASDNNGKFPAKLTDLIPDYIGDAGIFVSPLSAKKEAMGYDYFGGTDSDPKDKVLLRSKDLTTDGQRVIVCVDGSGVLKAGK